MFKPTDIVQSIPTTKITTATEPTTRMTQTPLKTKIMDTIETTPTVLTTYSIPTTLATTDATVKKGRIRQMKKVNIFKGN